MSVAKDIIQHLENQDIGKFGIALRTRTNAEMKEGVKWERIIVKEDPTFLYPKTDVNVDYHRIRITVTGTMGDVGGERCFNIANAVYKACRLQRDIEINNTYYVSIVAVQPPYESNYFTDINTPEMTLQVDVVRYTCGQLQKQCKEMKQDG